MPAWPSANKNGAHANACSSLPSDVSSTSRLTPAKLRIRKNRLARIYHRWRSIPRLVSRSRCETRENGHAGDGADVNRARKPRPYNGRGTVRCASGSRKACPFGHPARSTQGHGTAVPIRHPEMPVVRTMLHLTGAQCRGDPVGRPWCARWAAASRDMGPSCTIAPGRRTASPLHAVRAAACVAPANIAAHPPHPL